MSEPDPNGCCYGCRNFFAPKFFRSEANRRTPEKEGEKINLTVGVEALRVIAYCNFFIMVSCAIVLNNTLVAPKLREGSDGVCGAFNGEFGDMVDPPILPGEGFEVSTGSHLVRLFGYNNICANWDYSPSREITAMIYPIFEYCLLLYLFFEGVQAKLYHMKGWVSGTYYRTFCILFVPMIIGCAWFRMIFVVIAFENVSGHTAGFFGLQLTLIIVALLNTYFMIDSKAEFAWLGGRKGTLIVGLTYIVLNFVVSPLKLTLTSYIVFLGRPAEWSLNTIGSLYVGEFVDKVWFVFNAIIPLLVGFLRAFSEPPLIITVDVAASNYTDAEGNPIVDGEVKKEEPEVAEEAAEPAAEPAETEA